MRLKESFIFWPMSHAIFTLIAAQAHKAANTTQSDSFTIPGWSLQSSQNAGTDVAALSAIDYNDSSWHRVSSRSTVMAGLLQAGVYNDSELFFSHNLETVVDISQFTGSWYYRQKFPLQLAKGTYHLLHTNGITSKADVYFNGAQIANSTIQAGAYNGQWYNITSQARDGDNVLLIKTYPTDYDKDFALGFVDWNPYPPDNGTGVWRDVQVKQTGQAYATGLRVITDFTEPGDKPVGVTFKTDVHNLAGSPFRGKVQINVCDPTGAELGPLTGDVSLEAFETQTVSLALTVRDAQVWWPKAWGAQPLYTISGAVQSSDGAVSDTLPAKSFGIRHVMSHVNEHNDTVFSINGQPFQVLGAGYAPDMFLRFAKDRLTTQFQYMLDMGLNTVRLEGKQEHPELFETADRLGMMVMAGWECCDKWEAWTYNEDVTATLWDDQDYETARGSMRHEAAEMQMHPSLLAFLVGSDYWPDDRAAEIYVSTLRQEYDWQNPIIASAAKRGYPDILGPSGLKMDGPYDWVSPNYWWYGQLGAAFGFGSELGSGVGTPESGSLKKFLSDSDMDDLWQQPDKGLYHMSTNVSSFYDRSIYNAGLWARYGEPDGLEDYLLKAQMMDYEATRSEYEAYSALWNAARPATGLIYWMLNNAWPSLHWNLFDYYLHPAGSYYGTKVGSRQEHIAYDAVNKTLYLINHSLNASGPRTVNADLIGLDGTSLWKRSLNVTTDPNTSKSIGGAPDTSKIADTALLKLELKSNDSVLSRNVYWLSSKEDVLDWDNSTWYNTPVTGYADFTALNSMAQAALQVDAAKTGCSKESCQGFTLTLRNTADVPAVFIRMNLVDRTGGDVVPVYWSDNYVTLWPKEELNVGVEYAADTAGAAVQVSGKNVGLMSVSLA